MFILTISPCCLLSLRPMENDVQPHPYWFFSNIGSFPVKVTPKIYKVSICNIRLSFPTSQSNVIYKQL